MYRLENIRSIHLEITERCQAGCPLCPRYTPEGNLNPMLTDAELSLKQCQQFFPKKFVRQLGRMYMCGNYGDPIIASESLEVFEYFRYANPKMNLSMHTNGGARNTQWWRDLATLFYTDGSYVVFSIDGLEDTNHIYRKNVNWETVLRSAASFINAGGKALWSFLVFKHNEHQVEQARQLSEKLGFKKFIAKKSARFNYGFGPDYIQPPTNEEYRNINLKTIPQIESEYGSLELFYDKTPIRCVVKEQQDIYVSARGYVFPCCWIGGVHNDMHPISEQQTKNLYKDYSMIDLNKNSLEDIFKTGVFQTIEKSWNLPSQQDGKLRICARNCSSNHNFFKAQFE